MPLLNEKSKGLSQVIHSHIKKITLLLNEETYQCVLPAEVRDANETFEDSAGVEASWLSGIRQRQFKQKLRTARINIVRGTRILDACCGQGSLGEYLLHQGAAVTFCDLSSRQLASLRARLARHNLNADAIEANLHSLPFGDGEFEVVIGNSFLHHLSDIPRAVAELSRIVRPRGQLILLHEPSVNANYWETFPWSLVKNTTYNSNFTDLWQFEVGRLAKVLNAAGFGKVSISGSGLMAAFLVNWYFILLGKLRIASRAAVEPALRFRELCYLLERPFSRCMNQEWFPSLLIVAERESS